MTGKIPLLERDEVNGFIKNQSAAEWLSFLAEEANFNDDDETYTNYTRMARELFDAPEGSVYMVDLERAVEQWDRKLYDD